MDPQPSQIRNAHIRKLQAVAQAPLIEKANKLRHERNLTMEQMCKQLGIHRNLWLGHQNNSYPVRFDTLAGLARLFPELRDEIYIYLLRAPIRGGDREHAVDVRLIN